MSAVMAAETGPTFYENLPPSPKTNWHMSHKPSSPGSSGTCLSGHKDERNTFRHRCTPKQIRLQKKRGNKVGWGTSIFNSVPFNRA